MPQGVDCVARGGDVIIINNNNIHAGTVRETEAQRVDFRLDYGHRGAQLDHSTMSIPQRIWDMAPTLQDTTGLFVKAATPQWAVEAFKGAGGERAGGGVSADYGWRGTELQPRDSLHAPKSLDSKL